MINTFMVIELKSYEFSALLSNFIINIKSLHVSILYSKDNGPDSNIQIVNYHQFLSNEFSDRSIKSNFFISKT